MGLVSLSSWRRHTAERCSEIALDVLLLVPEDNVLITLDNMLPNEINLSPTDAAGTAADRCSETFLDDNQRTTHRS